MRIPNVLGYLVFLAALAGCAQGRVAQLTDQDRQRLPVNEAEQNALWEGNKEWLLKKLPQAALSAQRVTAVFNSYSGGKKPRDSRYDKGDYDKLFDFMRGKLGEYRMARSAKGEESDGQFALIDGDAAYLFDLTHREFSGVANLEKMLFFAVSDVPLERSDDRSFAFVANGKSDATTSWSLFRRNTLSQNQGEAHDLGSHTLNRVELDKAGVAKQIDFLTPQQRAERELARQGLIWRSRAERKAVQLCSGQQGRDGAKKQGGHSKHGGMGNRSPAGDGTSEGSAYPAFGSDNTTAEPSKGSGRLNCRTGSGNLQTDDGIVAEVSGLGRSRDGNLNPVVRSTSMSMTGATMTYSYDNNAGQNDPLWNQSGSEMELALKSVDGSNKLNLKLRPDTGVIDGSLVLPGEWYQGPGYSIAGKNVSNSEFAQLFMRAYRDCAIRDSQGACKDIPGLFVSLLNAGMAQDLVTYIGGHYISGQR